ncbi:hypothetical protein LTS12_027011, partial [Elasticomyces elasticus]
MGQTQMLKMLFLQYPKLLYPRTPRQTCCYSDADELETLPVAESVLLDPPPYGPDSDADEVVTLPVDVETTDDESEDVVGTLWVAEADTVLLETSVGPVSEEDEVDALSVLPDADEVDTTDEESVDVVPAETDAVLLPVAEEVDPLPPTGGTVVPLPGDEVFWQDVAPMMLDKPLMSLNSWHSEEVRVMATHSSLPLQIAKQESTVAASRFLDDVAILVPVCIQQHQCGGAEEVDAGAELVEFAEFETESEAEVDVDPPMMIVVGPVSGMETVRVVAPMALLLVVAFALLDGTLRLAELETDSELVETTLEDVVGASVTGPLLVVAFALFDGMLMLAELDDTVEYEEGPSVADAVLDTESLDADVVPLALIMTLLDDEVETDPVGPT